MAALPPDINSGPRGSNDRFDNINRRDPRNTRDSFSGPERPGTPLDERFRANGNNEQPQRQQPKPSKRYCHVRQRLSAEDKELLMTVFPEYELRFTDGSYTNHPFAAANRRLSVEILLDRGSRGNSFVVDIGGNWSDHVVNNRAHVHSCSPILDLRDAARWTERTNRCDQVITRSQRLGRGLDYYNSHRGEKACGMWCQEKTQDCNYQAEFGIAVHATYDIKFDTIGEIMTKHGMNTLHGCFTFFPELLREGETFELPSQGLFVRKDEKANTIEFAFKGEGTAAYVHKLSDYMEYLLRSYVRYEDNYFFYELMENRAGTQFFKFVRAYGPWSGRSKTVKYLWNGYKGCVLVKTLHLKEFAGTLIQERGDWGLYAEGIIVPKDLYDRALEYALSFKDVENCFRDLFSYIRSINNRVIVSGLNVTAPARIGADCCYHLAIAVYSIALKTIKEGDQVISRVKKWNRAKLERRDWSATDLMIRTAVNLTHAAVRGSFDRVFEPVREALIALNEVPNLDPEAKQPTPYIRVEEYVDGMLLRLIDSVPGLIDSLDDGIDWSQKYLSVGKIFNKVKFDVILKQPSDIKLKPVRFDPDEPDDVELREAEDAVAKLVELIKEESRKNKDNDDSLIDEVESIVELDQNQPEPPWQAAGNICDTEVKQISLRFPKTLEESAETVIMPVLKFKPVKPTLLIDRPEIKKIAADIVRDRKEKPFKSKEKETGEAPGPCYGMLVLGDCSSNSEATDRRRNSTYLGESDLQWSLRPGFLRSAASSHYQSAVSGKAFHRSSTMSAPELTEVIDDSTDDSDEELLLIVTEEQNKHENHGHQASITEIGSINPLTELTKAGFINIGKQCLLPVPATEKEPKISELTPAATTTTVKCNLPAKETGAIPKTTNRQVKRRIIVEHSQPTDVERNGNLKNPDSQAVVETILEACISETVERAVEVSEEIRKTADKVSRAPADAASKTCKNQARSDYRKGPDSDDDDKDVSGQRSSNSKRDGERKGGSNSNKDSHSKSFKNRSGSSNNNFDTDEKYARANSRISEYSTYLDKEYKNIVSETARHWKICYNQYTNQPSLLNVKACGDREVGFLIKASDTGKFTAFDIKGCKKPSGDYDYAFDGKELLRIELDETCISPTWIIKDSDKITSSNFLMVWRELQLVQCVKLRKYVTNAPRRSAIVTLVDGVPGCGKTRELLERAKPGDLIVTVARKTAIEMRERLQALDEKVITVKTVDSYILNSRAKHETVWLDEGLMVHPGVIDLLIGYSNCSKLFVYGDRNQLNFVCRVSGFVIKHQIFEDFQSIETRNLSYRVPQDVAKNFSALYDGGFETTNKVRKSLTKVKVANISQVCKSHQKYLTFTQEEKKDLLKRGFRDVNTVHEVQGMTFADVALVRLNPKSINTFESRPHILVGLSRHTASFTYYTVKDDDPISQAMTVGYSKRKRKSVTQKIQKGLAQSREMLMRTVKVEPAECISKRRQEIADTIITATGNYHKKPSDHFYEEHFTDPLWYLPPHAAAHSLADPVNAIQTYYDETLPGASCDSKIHDEDQIETRDIKFDLENVNLDFSKDGVQTRRMFDKDKGVESVLRTAQPNKRTSTFRQQCLALQKRNCDTPANGYPVDLDETTMRVLKNFTEKFLRKDYPDVLKTFAGEPVIIESDNTWQWVNGQELTKLERIDMKTWEATADAGQRYEMMIKSEAKNKLELDAYMEYLVPQNIIHHNTTLNAVFGPVFKILFSRFQEILDPRICVMLRKSLTDLEQHMNAWLPVGKDVPFFEMDFSKFDKCQTEVCFTIEMKIWELLGLDDMLLQIWKTGHFSSTALDFRNGIKAILFYQRKSGDAATAFGNTLVSMFALADTTSLESLIAGYFIGDDSLLFTAQKEDQSRAIDDMRTTFNLTAKLLEMKTAYFCSMFVMNGPDGRVLVPDPLKRMERLGKSLDFVSEGHTSFIAGVRERYVSFKEIIQPLNNEIIYEQVAEGLLERYGGTNCATKQALSALMTLGNDFQLFRRLWPVDDTVHVSKKRSFIKVAADIISTILL